jgi:hypothetical protein
VVDRAAKAGKAAPAATVAAEAAVPAVVVQAVAPAVAMVAPAAKATMATAMTTTATTAATPAKATAAPTDRLTAPTKMAAPATAAVQAVAVVPAVTPDEPAPVPEMGVDRLHRPSPVGLGRWANPRAHIWPGNLGVDEVILRRVPTDDEIEINEFETLKAEPEILRIAHEQRRNVDVIDDMLSEYMATQGNLADPDNCFAGLGTLRVDNPKRTTMTVEGKYYNTWKVALLWSFPGVIIPGTTQLKICHKCTGAKRGGVITRCQNPFHMKIGTDSENKQDIRKSPETLRAELEALCRGESIETVAPQLSFAF